MLEGRCAEVENQNDSKQVSKVWKIFSLVFFRGNITTVDSIYLCFFCPYFSQKQNVKESQIKPIKANRQCLLTVWMNTVHKLLQVSNVTPYKLNPSSPWATEKYQLEGGEFLWRRNIGSWKQNQSPRFLKKILDSWKLLLSAESKSNLSLFDKLYECAFIVQLLNSLIHSVI